MGRRRGKRRRRPQTKSLFQLERQPRSKLDVFRCAGTSPPDHRAFEDHAGAAPQSITQMSFLASK
eukprot:12880594-Prorocentrum_lima.AAC.1